MSVTYTVSYTSNTEGITVGVSADSFVTALGALVEEFGEGVVPLYEHTRNEFIDLCRAVDVTSEKEDDEEESEGPAAEDPEPEAEATAEGEREGDSGTAEGGRTTEEGTGGEGGGDDVCLVCGVSITKDRAKASTLMLGEPRCSECTV